MFIRPLYYDYFGHMEVSKEEMADATKKFNESLSFIEKSLGDNFFLIGDVLTIADIIVAGPLTVPYQTWFGADFYNKFPKTAAWLERIVNLPSFVRRFGYIKKGYQGEGNDASAPAGAAKAADDFEMDDLFGADDEPEKPVVVKKKAKKKVIAMSLVMLEVKPLDDQTSLDDLAKKIFAEITQDGLFWKTEYKKEPIAFGIFKLIVGFSCEDEKVSVDNIVEQIEGIEDMVQSVEIQAFNKI